MAVGREEIFRFRLAAANLDRRLPAGTSPAVVTRVGLQDSAPRAGLLGLHARLDGIDPASWAHPDLVQVYGPRAAAYIVPADSVAPFTLGRMPRNPAKAAEIEAQAAAVVKLLRAGTRSPRLADLNAAFEALGHRLLPRWASPAGTLRIIWDARTCELVAAPRPDVDVEDARCDLARRFLSMHGPATAVQFAKWAGVDPGDAKATWRAIAGDLATVETPDGLRELLAPDIERLDDPQPAPTGLRLLPSGDGFCYLDRPLLVASAGQREAAFPAVAVVGTVLRGIEVVGTWRRQGGRVTIEPFGRWSKEVQSAAATAEAESFVGPIGGSVEVRWAESA